MEFFVGLCVLVCLLFGIIQAENVTVSTDIGNFVGQTESITLTDNKTRSVTRFLGIPFAEPPVGNLRFSKPVPKVSFTEPFEAFQYGPSCIQTAKVDEYGLAVNQNEDCLTLNIFTPQVNGSYSVMIFIYGCTYNDGGSSLYSANILSSYGDVVIVTINYRLGPFGFLSTDDDYVPGNAGLWDQHLAIKWVSERIAHFGGDVSRITIFGESAGAVSVGLQSIYTENKDLFQRAIMQGGSPNSFWAVTRNGPSVIAMTGLAKKMNCPNTDDRRRMVECLREVTNATELAWYASDFIWSPRVDEEMITSNALASLKRHSPLQSANQHVDILLGTNGFEGHFMIRPPGNLQIMENGTNAEVKSAFNESAKFLLSIDRTVDYSEELMSAVMFQYSDVENPHDRHYFLKKVTDLFTDRFFSVPAAEDLLSHSRENNQTKTYHFEYNHRSAYTYPDVEWLTGATHGDELDYLFGKPLSILNSSEADVNVSKYLINYWTNFAKTGHPNTPSTVPTSWREFDQEDKYYLYFPTDKVPEVRQRLDAKRMFFWMDYALKLNMVKPSPPPKPCITSHATFIHSSTLMKSLFTILVMFKSLY